MSCLTSRKESGPRIPIDPIQHGYNNIYAKWTSDGPTVDHFEVLGYVDAPNQDCFSRDIGRSFHLNGRTYYIFGDTFCNSAGLVSNSVQVIPDRSRPRIAYYIATDGTGRVPPLIDIDADERQYLTDPGNEAKRIAFWCFGGIVEVTQGIGWTWYQKHIITKGGGDELAGVGVARICHTKDRLSGELSCTRMPGLIFDKDMPLFGSFSTLLEDDMVYLWGQRGADICLARVYKENCHLLYRYEFWNGKEYVFQIDGATPVLQDFQQGQIFKSELFGPSLPWVFIGVTRWADSMVMIGVASRVEGPWDIRPLFKAQGINNPNSYQYCMYPHPWATDQRTGQLLLSWCDPWPGGVIVAKVTLNSDARIHWATLILETYSEKVACRAAKKAAEICRSSSLRFAELTNPRRLHLSGTDERKVELGANMIRHQIGVGLKEEVLKAQRGSARLLAYLAKVFVRGDGE